MEQGMTNAEFDAFVGSPQNKMEGCKMFKVYIFLKDDTFELWTFDDMQMAYNFAKDIYDDFVDDPDSTNVSDVRFDFPFSGREK